MAEPDRTYVCSYCKRLWTAKAMHAAGTPDQHCIYCCQEVDEDHAYDDLDPEY